MDTIDVNSTLELANKINHTHQFLLKGICPDSAKEILFAQEQCFILELVEALEEMKLNVFEKSKIEAA